MEAHKTKRPLQNNQKVQTSRTNEDHGEVVGQEGAHTTRLVGLWGVQMHKMMCRRHGGREECKTTLQGVARKMILRDQEPWDCCCCSTRLLHPHPQAHPSTQIQTAPAKNLGCDSAHSPPKHAERCVLGYLQTTLERLEPHHLQRVGYSHDCGRLACSAVAMSHVACHQVCLPSRPYTASSPVELWNFCHGSPGGTSTEGSPQRFDGHLLNYRPKI